MRKSIQSLINRLIGALPERLSLRLQYFINIRSFLSLRNPKRFTEKLQWIKVYGNLELYTQYADKYELRGYVKSVIGEHYLIPLLGVWEKFDEIPFKALPKKFVIKATHGSGYNFICLDKAALNRREIKAVVNKWTNENYYNHSRETQYKLCKPRIICEKYIEDPSGNLKDYKFFCFNGEPVIVQLDSDRFTGHRTNLMDLNWNKLPVNYTYPNLTDEAPKPMNFDKMLEISRKLSKPFPFVRVDLYSVKDRIYFGELTFTPGSGLYRFTPNSYDYWLGEYLDLTKYGKKS